MKRPKSHETDTRAQRLFEGALPASWVPRRLSPDYGVDYEVEIFRSGESTGATFRAQLKGTTAPVLVDGGRSLAHRLRVDRARYLCLELRVPTIIVFADLTSGMVYWCAPQLDAQLKDRLASAEARGSAEVKVLVPTANSLPDTMEALVAAVADASLHLGTREVMESEIPRFVGVTSGQLDRHAAIAAFETKAAALKLQTLGALYEQGAYRQAQAQLRAIIGAAEVSPEVKFSALWVVWGLETKRLQRAQAYPDAHARLDMSVAREMKSVTVKGPLHLRVYAAIACRAADLALLAFRDWGMYLNWRAHESNPDVLWRVGLSYARYLTARQVVRRYAECIRLFNFAIRTNQLGIVPHAACRVISALPQFLFRLDAEGLQAATAYRDSVRDVAETAIDIGVALERWDEVGVLTLKACLLLRLGGQSNVCESADWGGKQLARIRDCGKRNEYSSLLDTYFETAAAELATQDASSQGTEEQIYYNMAMGLGIDLTDDSDAMAQLVAQGIADINPERVLKPCRHLFVSLGWSPVLGDWLRLPTMGSKRLHCTRHGYLVEALSLDGCSHVMTGSHCSACADAEPHDESWHWTPAWQMAQNGLHARLIHGISDASGGGGAEG